MDALCGLFEAVACFSEVVSRSDEKNQELTALASTVESVSQSVRAFSSSLPFEDREAVFHSNQVFLQLGKVLQQCSEVIAKHRPLASELGPERLEDPPTGKAWLRSTFQHGSRTFHEGLEVLGSKFGSLGSGLLRLPEDELAVMRQANAEITRLVPQLQLAIQAVSLAAGGVKRKADELLSLVEAPVIEEAPPLLLLQLVSDAPSFQSLALPALTTRDLRPITAASTTSLDSGSAGSGQEGMLDDSVRLVFGRLELRDKVPKNLTLPAKKRGEPPQPVSRFVSRDLLLLALPPAVAIQDSLEMATLCFGYADEGLSQGPSQGTQGQIGDDLPLAVASGLTAQGIHFRAKHETRWRWLAKDVKVDVREGDRIAALLESPPGSCTPSPQQDLGANEAICLLGLELHKPTS